LTIIIRVLKSGRGVGDILSSFLLSVVDEKNKVLYFYEKYDKELIKYAKSVLKNVDGKNYSSNAGDVV